MCGLCSSRLLIYCYHGYQTMCLCAPILAHLGHMLCLHVREACCRSSLSPSPTILLSSSRFLTSLLMSHKQSSSNFQLIFDDAFRAYKKRTKKDLSTHPLAAHLQRCNTPSSILDVLQQQVQEPNQSQCRNERWTRWLDPTVKVLYAFSETLGEGGTLVCLSSCICLRSALPYLFDRHSHRQ